MLNQEDLITEENSRRKAESAMERLMAEELGEDPPPNDEPPADPPPADEPPVDEPPPGDEPPADEPPADPPPEDAPPEPPPATDKPTSSDTPPVTDADVDEAAKLVAEIDKIEINPKARPAEKRALQAMKKNSTALFEQLKKTAERAKASETELAAARQQKLLTPELEQEIEGHRQFRQVFDYRNTSEYQQKFVAKRGELETSANQILTDETLPPSNRLPSGTAEYMKKLAGGMLAFATSQKPMPENATVNGKPLGKNPDGTPVTQEQFFNEHIEPALTTAQKVKLNRLKTQQIELGVDEEEAVKNAGTRAQQIMAEREKNQAAQLENFRTEAAAAGQAWIKANPDFGERREVPKAATADEAKAINERNALIDRAEGLVKRVVVDFTPKVRMEMAMNHAAMLTTVPVVLKSKDATIARLTKENQELLVKINKIKDAGKTRNLGQTGAKPIPPAAKKETPEEMASRQEREYWQQQNQNQ